MARLECALLSPIASRARSNHISESPRPNQFVKCPSSIRDLGNSVGHPMAFKVFEGALHGVDRAVRLRRRPKLSCLAIAKLGLVPATHLSRR